jgi:7-cyano-7-deazaguanine synthase
VPGRNLIFLAHAASYAYTFGIRDLVTGVCQTDYSGYPDCRDETIRSLEKALGLGLDLSGPGRDLLIHTPLMYKTKAESVRWAAELGAMESLALSHTCYEGLYPPCGVCPACTLRSKGFAEAGVEDPLVARAAGRKVTGPKAA